ncbi:MAG: chromate transporter [Clostridiales Family XIII bacterium]|jgi:chromate transporter|nr:chromate transporter [Clostridiales Family XIII bacterium]
MEKNLRNFIRFFGACVYLSAFTVGGGYVIVPLMQKNFVEKYGWIDEKEMLSFVSIAQSAPGSIAINTANLVGWKLFGFAGAVVAVVATILPPLLITFVISIFYMNFRDNEIVRAVLTGMTAGIAALIMDVVCTMLGKLFRDRKVLPVIIFAAAFLLAVFTPINVVFILIFCAAFGVIIGSRTDKKGRDLL